MNLRKSKKKITTTEDRRCELRTSKVEFQHFPAKKGCKWRLFTGHFWESSHLSTQLLSNHRWLHPNTLVVWFHRHSFVLEASCYENHNPSYNLTPPKTFLAQLRLPTFLLHVCPNLLQLWTSQHVSLDTQYEKNQATASHPSLPISCPRGSGSGRRRFWTSLTLVDKYEKLQQKVTALPSLRSDVQKMFYRLHNPNLRIFSSKNVAPDTSINVEHVKSCRSKQYPRHPGQPRRRVSCCW